MIQVTELQNGVLIKGHAMYGPHGSDIVCAGITTLAESLILSIDQLTPNMPDFVMEKGYIKVRVGSPTETTKILLDSFFVGAENIAQQFPDNVRVTRLESQ